MHLNKPNKPNKPRGVDVPTVDPTPWETIIPFTETLDLPEFPVDALPPVMRVIVIEISETVDIAADVAAMAALTLMSVGALGKFRYRIGNHFESPPIWTCSVLRSGERKTPVFVITFESIYDWQEAQDKRLEPEIKAAAEMRSIEEARLKSLRRKAADAKEPAEQKAARDEAVELAKNLTEVPQGARITVQDVTPEAIPKLLQENRGRLVLISDEGGLFATIAGRYSGTPNVDAINKAYSGSAIEVDRVNRDANKVRHPQLSVALTVQPVILEAMRTEDCLRGTGYLARFAYSVPESRVGRRFYKNREMDPVSVERLRDAVMAMMGDVELEPPAAPRTIELTEEALALWAAFHDRVELDLQDGGRLCGIADWANKLAGQVARIAGACHCFTNGDRDAAAIAISAETMASAIQIGEYLIEHALAAFNLMGADGRQELATWVIKWIRRHKKTTFSTADIRDHKRDVDADELSAAIEFLEERNYVRPLPPPATKGRGRPPARRWEVHPELCSKADPPSINSVNSDKCPSEPISPNKPNSPTPLSASTDDDERGVAL